MNITNEELLDMLKYEVITNKDGTKFWYKNGEIHRDNDLPAIEYSGGTKAWYKNGKRHRDDDLPAIERADGYKEWWVDGKFIRVKHK